VETTLELRELRSDRIAVRVLLNPRVDGSRGPGESALFRFEVVSPRVIKTLINLISAFIKNQLH
jgi:hypothetical protein